MRFAVGVKRGGDRIDDGFNGTIGQRENEGACVKSTVTISAHRNDRRENVAAPREGHHSSIADLIDDETEEDNAERLGIESGALDGAELGFGEIELASPLSDEKGAHDKTDGGCDERNDA